MRADERAAFRIPRVDLAKIVVLALLRAASLIAFVLLVAAVADALGAETLGAAATAAWADTMRQLGLLVVVVVAHGALRSWEFSISEKAGYDVVRRLRMQMFAHMQGIPPRQLQVRSHGGLLLRFMGDLSMLRTWLSRGLAAGLAASIVLVVTLGALIVMNSRIGLALLAALSLGAALSLAGGPAIRRITRTMRRRRSLLTSNIIEQLHAPSVAQVFGRTGGEYSRLSRQNDSLNRSLHRTAELRGRLRGVYSASALLGVVAVLAVGLVEVRRGTATVGSVVAALLLAQLLVRPVRTLGLAHDYWQRSEVSRHKVLGFLRSPGRDLDPPELAALRVRRGRIEFREVTLPGALSAVSLTAEPGQLVGIAGPSGAGKSTLLALVARLVEPSEGEVVIDDQPLASTTPRSTLRHIGMLGPDLPLLRGTVRRNLTYSDRDASPEEVRRVVLSTGLDRVLHELPHGLATWVLEGGRNLSTGQRQRIALARAMVGNPPILLLDEPTANLDPPARAEIRRVLAHHQGTVLLVSHDPDELALADQVWMLDRGRVQEVLSGDEYRSRAMSRKEGAWPKLVAG